jgi:hypothetical protein
MEEFCCEDCGEKYRDLSAHWRWHPDCAPLELYEDSDSGPESGDEDDQPVSLVQRVSGDVRLFQISGDLADLRFEHGMDNSAVADLKTKVNEWVKGAAIQGADSLKPYLLPGIAKSTVIAALTVDLFAGLETAKLENRQARKGAPIIKPRIVDYGTNEICASFDIGELITRKLQHDPAYRKACFGKSNEWKRGELWQQAPTGAIKNFDDGIVARYHPHLMRPAAADEELDLRIAIDLNADDVEACFRVI